MPRLQLLVATMNLTDIIGLCDEMHIASDALIINQADSVKYEYVFYHGYKIECYTFAERGLSRSRNNALLRCTGDILCIADDDMVYTDTYGCSSSILSRHGSQSIWSAIRSQLQWQSLTLDNR